MGTLAPLRGRCLSSVFTATEDTYMLKIIIECSNWYYHLSRQLLHVARGDISQFSTGLCFVWSYCDPTKFTVKFLGLPLWYYRRMRHMKYTAYVSVMMFFLHCTKWCHLADGLIPLKTSFSSRKFRERYERFHCFYGDEHFMLWMLQYKCYTILCVYFFTLGT